MNFPIWVWLYDWGPYTHPEMWTNGCLVEALPQAMTYAFLSEEDAMKYAEEKWSKDHGYILQKTFLQTDMTYPAMSDKAVLPEGVKLQQAAPVKPARKAAVAAKPAPKNVFAAAAIGGRW